jgi:ferric-dicitrate binding protein FerR (iron transport regulator)
MPVALAPITPELFADFRGGKESALEQLFRSNFDALTKEAVGKVEDVAAAQKVVASAFLELWDRRAKPQSAAQLEDLLRQIVDSGVAHEQRRRATVHRMAEGQAATAPHHHDPEPTEKVWALMVAELHAEKTDPKVRAQRLAERSRHGAATHMAHVAKPSGSRTVLIAVVVVLAVLVAVPLWYLNRGAAATKAEQALNRNDARPMLSAAGQRGKVTLEDSTTVFMGANSVVKLTSHFPQDFRAVQVTGTASFNAPVGTTPLLVQVGKAWVTAAGTEFVVRHFDDDPTAMIKVIKGSASVMGTGLERTLGDGAMAQVDSAGVISDLPADRASEAFSWVDGNFVMQNQSLKAVLVALKRWYKLDITAKDTSIVHRNITMTASLESSKAAITALEQSGGVTIGYEGQKLVVKDTIPGAAKKPAAVKKKAKK